MKSRNSKILLVAVVFFWFAQYVYIPYQTPYLNSLQLSSSFIGVIIGTYGFSQMILRLPVGLLADLKDRHKIIIMIGALSSGLASLFRVILGTGMGFWIANVFSGLASAMWISFMVLYMSYFEDQQKATGNIILANNLGMLLGFVTSTLLYDIVGMKVICLFSVISGIIAAVLALNLKEEEKPAKNITVKELLKICTQKQLIMFSLLAIIQQGTQMSTTMSYTTQIIKDLGASSMVVGMASIIYMLSAVLFAKVSSTDQVISIGPKKLIPLTFLTTALYCLLVPNAGSVPVLCVLQILPGLSTGILFTFLTSEAMKYVPAQKKSTAMGFFQAVYALGMTVFPMICGAIASAYSLSYAYYFLMCICILGMISVTIYYKKVS